MPQDNSTPKPTPEDFVPVRLFNRYTKDSRADSLAHTENAEIPSEAWSRDTVPEILWHYTERGGMYGISKDKALRATSLHYMNDTDEVLDCFKLFEEVADSQYRQACEESRANLDAVGYYVKNNLRFHIFAVSFSEKRDDLYQWNSYAKHQGYALGFCRDFLNTLANRNTCLIGKCIHADSEKKSRMTDLVTRICEAHVDTEEETDRRSLFRTYAKELFFLATLFKNQAFAAENEWRLFTERLVLFSDREEYDVRESSWSMVPYKSFKFPNEGEIGGRQTPLIEVMVGPRPDPTPDCLATYAFLEKASMIAGVPMDGHDNVVCTQIPFRSTG